MDSENREGRKGLSEREERRSRRPRPAYGVWRTLGRNDAIYKKERATVYMCVHAFIRSSQRRVVNRGKCSVRKRS